MIRERLDKPVRVDEPVRGQIDGRRRLLDGKVWSWWILGPTQWSFRTTSIRESTVGQAAAGWASAAGHDVHLLMDQVPFGAVAWAADLDESTPDPLPDVPGCDETWTTLVNRDQDSLAGEATPIEALGVCLGPIPRGHKLGDQLPADLLAVEAGLDERLSGHGMEARPATARELAWLTARAAMPGHTPPPLPPWDRWDKDECRQFGDTRKWGASPTGRTVKVTVGRDGQLVERWVAVLTMGRMETQEWPQNGRAPWLAFSQHLVDPATGRPIPVRVSGSGRILSGDEAVENATKWLRRARGIRKHYAEHNEEPPPTVARTVQHAVDVFDEVSEAPPDVAARFRGVIRFAVDGATEEEAMSYARLLVDAYQKHQHMWPVQPGGIAEPFAPSRMLREFSPGARPDTSGYCREMPVRYLAAGVPNQGRAVGTPTGMLLGHTVDATPLPVLHDPHYPMAHNRPGDPNNNSGFFGCVSNLGGGKSYLLGTLAEQSVRAGIPTRVLDASPGAPMAKLCHLPYLAPYAVHIALSGAEAGLLNPYRMIPDPIREPGWDDGRWMAELAGAAGDRKELVSDTLMQLMPESTRRRDGTEEAVRDAVAKAGGGYGTNPREVLRYLEETSEVFASAARNLREMADGIARLIFPPTTPQLVKDIPRQALLTVITTGDLAIPDPDSNRDDWTGRERAAYTALGLAAFLISRGVYTGRPTDPKTVIIDEFRVISEWKSGRTLVRKLGFDGRKYRAAIVAACQDPDHLSSLGVAPFLGGMWLGRQRDLDVAVKCMRMAGIPVEYAPVLLGLQTGQFVHTDTFSRVKLMAVKPAHPLLDAALTPGSEAPALRGVA